MRHEGHAPRHDAAAAGKNGRAAEFAFTFTIDANRSLTFTLHEVYLALAKTSIEGLAC